MWAVRTSETSVYFNEIIQCYNPEGCNLQLIILVDIKFRFLKQKDVTKASFALFTAVGPFGDNSCNYQTIALCIKQSPLEKPTVFRQVKKFPILYGIRKFTAVLIGYRH
jgi:hypothetical protein